MSNNLIDREITQGIIPIGTPKAYKYDAALVEAAKAAVQQGMAGIAEKTEEKKTEIDSFADNEMQSYANAAAASAQAADTTATALITFLETKETLTAPAVDTTLTVAGAAADAKVTGNFKSYTEDIIDSLITVDREGFIYITNANWVHGNISVAGNKSYAEIYTYQVMTDEAISFPYPVTIKSKAGYCFRIKTFSSSNISSATHIQDYGNNHHMFKVPSNTYFALIVRRDNNATDEMSIAEGSNSVYIEGAVERVAELLSKISEASSAASSTMNALIVNIDNLIFEINTHINDEGIISNTESNVFVSRLYQCAKGDVISFKLSCERENLMFAVYGEDGTLTHMTAGAGYDGYKEETYTFTENDISFRLAGAASRINEYMVKYESKESPDIGELTTASKKIVELEEAVEQTNYNQFLLPTYWTDYLKTKIPTIRNKLRKVGKHGDSFIFITDVHYDRNSLFSPAIIKQIIANTTVSKVFNGGDTLDEDESTDTAMEKMFSWRRLMAGVEEYCIVGNHDNNNYNSQNVENALTLDDYYAAMTKVAEKYTDTNGRLFYTVDNTSQKIRYIVVCAAAFPEEFYNVPETWDWFKSKLTELDSTWTILVLQHYLWASSVETIHGNGQLVIDNINEVYSNIRANFVGILAGHTHADNTAKELVNGYNLIATLCDTRSGATQSVPRTKGTVNEQAFDVVSIDTTERKVYMIRIGAGADREVNY